MKIAELFINLGIKGDSSAVKSLKSMQSGLGEAKSMAFETKAAILGVVYGLQQLMSKSAQAGADLAQFSASTGLSAETLQRWQYAARQFNVGAEEINSNIKTVQDGMTNMLLGKGAPEGLGLLANTVGFDPTKARDTFYVMEQLQKFAQQVPADVSKNIMKSFGLSEGVIAAMRRNAFNAKAFSQANIYSAGEAESLRKINVGWENMGDKFSKALGRMNVKHGAQLMKDLDMILTKVLQLSDAFMQLAEHLKVFKLIGMVFEGWGMILDGANTIAKDLKKGNYNSYGGGPVAGLFNEALKSAGQIAHGAYLSATEDAVAPKMPRQLPSSKTQNINVNQNLNFQHEGKDHKKTSDSVKKAVREAYRQMPAQVQGD